MIKKIEQLLEKRSNKVLRISHFQKPHINHLINLHLQGDIFKSSMHGSLWTPMANYICSNGQFDVIILPKIILNQPEYTDQLNKLKTLIYATDVYFEDYKIMFMFIGNKTKPTKCWASYELRF